MVSRDERDPAFLPRAELGRLLDLLHGDGRRSSARPSATAPSSTTRSRRVADLPAGWTATAGARLATAWSGPATDRLFDYAVGPTSWKR